MSRTLHTVVLVVASILLPFMMALLFVAGAEAFFGVKGPMFEGLIGLLLGAVLAAFTISRGLDVRDATMKATANGLLIAVILIDLLAIPIARWLIRTAYASPNHVIELW